MSGLAGCRRLGTVGSDPVKRVVAALLGVVLASVGRVEPRALSRTRPPRIDAVVVAVADLDRAERFYTDVLTFSKESQREGPFESVDRLTGVSGSSVRVASLRLGSERVALIEYQTPRGRVVPIDSRSDDRWFQHLAIVVSDMDAAFTRLAERKTARISARPQTIPSWNTAARGIRAFYFRDPDNHPLELISFPADKGDPRWHSASGGLFLGIDHTAIVVGDTQRSVGFYSRALGLTKAGESLNYGIEQEQLNGVVGSRVRITSLRARGGGPGIELLEYLAPRNGRLIPVDSVASDLWFSETVVAVDDFRSALLVIRNAGGTVVSRAPTTIEPIGTGGALGVVARDPDGHGLLVRSQR
jgi:catechol 2,3-dioxygenase-like lactoylglutathione lyase family enzyme